MNRITGLDHAIIDASDWDRSNRATLWAQNYLASARQDASMVQVIDARKLVGQAT